MVSVDRRDSAESALEAELRERVMRLVATRGVSPARVQATVRQVVAALPAASVAAPEPSLLATFAATRADLLSALRAAAPGAGVRLLHAGRGIEGRHTVCAVLVPDTDRDKLSALAASVGALLSVGEAPLS